MARSTSIREESEFEDPPGGTMLPSQYFVGIHRGRFASGEKRLMLAFAHRRAVLSPEWPGRSPAR